MAELSKVQQAVQSAGNVGGNYGKASDYNRIFEANRDQLNDPGTIREGMTLRIP